MTPRRFAAAAAAAGALACCFYLGVVGEELFGPTTRLLLLSLPIPLAFGVYMLVLLLRERDKDRSLVEERLAAAPGLGLAPSFDGVPPAIAQARPLTRGRTLSISCPLRGSWDGGELLLIERKYLKNTDDDELESRRWQLLFAFQIPDGTTGLHPDAPWRFATLDGWAVLWRTSDDGPVATAELAGVLAQATALARKILPPR